MSFTDEEIIAKHLEIKAAKDAHEEAYKKKNGEYNRLMQTLEGVLNARILAKGAEANSISTPAGIAFQRTTTYVRVSDKEAFKKHILDTGDATLINFGETVKEAVESFMEKYEGHAPPGVTVTKIKQTITRV